MFRSTSSRLAALYTGGFAVAVAILGLLTVLGVRTALAQQFDTRISTELEAIKADYDEGGARGLLDEIAERKGNPGELSFGVQTAAGKALGGALGGLAAPSGWSTTRIASAGRTITLRVLTRDLPGGYRLLVADDVARMQGLDRSIVWGFGLVLAGVIVIGAAGGFALSRAVHRRLSAISGTAEAIIDGDLSRRVPVGPGGDDLSSLALTINRMLDRIGGLMESLRQVSSDIAHDLRTPLTRLRQRLEAAKGRADDPAHRAELDGALHDVDAILATFAALLRIAEVEAGARRRAFRRLDLAALVRGVFEDYAPAADDAGRALTVSAAEPAWIEGDADLLVQMLVNLVENALTHTPPGVRVDLAVSVDAEGVTLAVRDHGPGVPVAERERLFDRFYRLERSRSTPGSGLGLALVAAVARLHRAEVRLLDAGPGLEARITFQQSPA